MDIGIIGSGQVAQTLGGKFLDLGHSVTISSRDSSQAKDRGEWGVIPSAEDWAAAQRAGPISYGRGAARRDPPKQSAGPRAARPRPRRATPDWPA